MCCMLNTMTCRVYALNIWINKDNFEDLSPNSSYYNHVSPEIRVNIVIFVLSLNTSTQEEFTRQLPAYHKLHILLLLSYLRNPDKQDCKSPIRNRHGPVYWWLIYSQVLLVPLSLSTCIKIEPVLSLHVWCCLQYGHSPCTIKQYLKFIPPRIVREYYHPGGITP